MVESKQLIRQAHIFVLNSAKIYNGNIIRITSFQQWKELEYSFKINFSKIIK